VYSLFFRRKASGNLLIEVVEIELAPDDAGEARGSTANGSSLSSDKYTLLIANRQCINEIFEVSDEAFARTIRVNETGGRRWKDD